MKTQFDALTFSTKALSAIVGGTVIRESHAPHKGLVTDSRIAEKNNIFLALCGENADGHNFIGAAAANGATCIIAERITEDVMRKMPHDCAVILVPNTLYALGALGKWHLNSIQPTVIAITGSVGKTTTKQMIHSVMRAAYPTGAMCTDGNYNNEIGLPLTLMQIKADDRIAVLEAGMSFAGELHRLSLLSTPNITVITNIGTSHIENLGSREGIRDAKLEMLDGMKAGGTVILSGDEPLLFEKKDDILARDLTPIYFATQNKESDYLIENVRMTPTGGLFDLKNTKTGQITRDLYIPVTGEHNVGNAAAAFLCGQLMALSEEDIRRGLSAFQNTGYRQKIFDYESITVIEDCYNASPESMEAALRVLSALAEEKKKRSIAVLGDMKELGTYAPRLHKRVGNFAAGCGIDLLFTIGENAADLAEGAVIGGMSEERIVCLPTDTDAAAQILRTYLTDGDTVLFKASRAMALENIVNALISN